MSRGGLMTLGHPMHHELQDELAEEQRTLARSRYREIAAE